MTQEWTETRLAELPVRAGVRQRGVDMTLNVSMPLVAIRFEKAVKKLQAGDEA